MKTLSLKLDENIFEESEKITSELKIARNRYINEAVNVYNMYNKKKLLKKRLLQESKTVKLDSMEVLSEFERLLDAD